MIYEVDGCVNYDFRSSSMAENRDFLYSLTYNIMPKSILELGTYYGCSYFAFAQAIKDYKLDTILTGIDSWQGDEHTLFYAGGVEATFNRLRDEFFPDENYRAIKGFFNEVADSIPDDSVDILLIDGRHNAEDAKEDFETYLPKLKKDGIILFHDVLVPWFSVKDYWSKISLQYPSTLINNQYGLGILAPKGTINFDEIKI